MEKDKLKSLKKRMNKLTNELKELILEIQEEELQNTQEAIDAYGRTILCKKQLKPIISKTQKKQEKRQLKKDINKINKQLAEFEYYNTKISEIFN